jgi:serine protease Do
MRQKFFIANILVLLIVIAGGLFGCSASVVNTPATTPAASDTPTTSPITQPTLPTITEVVATAKPSVVAINDIVTTYDIFNRPVKEQGAGSGWIIRSDGYVVTNNHVVEGATNIVVTLNDGRSFPSVQVYTDPVTDLAVVKIDAQNLPALVIGNSSDLNVGDWVVAIGNALGQGIGATKGL